MIRIFVAAVAVSMAAPVWAQDVPDRVAVTDFIRNEGCQAGLEQLTGTPDLDVNRMQSGLNALLSLGFAELTPEGAIALAPAVCGLKWAPGPEVLTAALRLHGCTLTEASGEVMLPPFGLDQTTTTPLVRALIGAGEAVLSDDEQVLTLTAPLCAGAELAPLPAAAMTPAGGADGPRDRFIRMLAENGCSITEAEFEQQMGRYGLTEDNGEDVAEGLMDAGQAVMMGRVFILDRAVCDTAVVAATPTPPPPPAGADPLALFVGAIRANDCAMTQDEAAAIVPGLGLTMPQVDEFADNLMDRGEAFVKDGALVLTAAVCAGGDMVADQDLQADVAADVAAEVAADVAVVAAPSVPPSQAGAALSMETFVAAMRANGCQMTAAESQAYLASVAASPEALAPIFEALERLALIRSDAGGMALSEAMCGG